MKNKIFQTVTALRDKADKKVIAVSLGVGSALGSAVPVFADETGTSVLDASIKTAISKGANDLLATVTDVIGLTIPVTIVAIATVAGCRFALKQVKGVLAHAS